MKMIVGLCKDRFLRRDCYSHARFSGWKRSFKESKFHPIVISANFISSNIFNPFPEASDSPSCPHSDELTSSFQQILAALTCPLLLLPPHPPPKSFPPFPTNASRKEFFSGPGLLHAGQACGRSCERISGRGLGWQVSIRPQGAKPGCQGSHRGCHSNYRHAAPSPHPEPPTLAHTLSKWEGHSSGAEPGYGLTNPQPNCRPMKWPSTTCPGERENTILK